MMTPTDKAALRFLAQGPDEMPRTLATDEQMAAAMVFSDLKRRGLMTMDVCGDTIKIALTDAGVEAIISECNE